MAEYKKLKELAALQSVSNASAVEAAAALVRQKEIKAREDREKTEKRMKEMALRDKQEKEKSEREAAELRKRREKEKLKRDEEELRKKAAVPDLPTKRSANASTTSNRAQSSKPSYINSKPTAVSRGDLTREELRALKQKQSMGEYATPASISHSSAAIGSSRKKSTSSTSGLKTKHQIDVKGASKAVGSKGVLARKLGEEGMQALNTKKRDMRTIDEIERDLKARKLSKSEDLKGIDFLKKPGSSTSSSSSSKPSVIATTPRISISATPSSSKLRDPLPSSSSSKRPAAASASSSAAKRRRRESSISSDELDSDDSEDERRRRRRAKQSGKVRGGGLPADIRAEVHAAMGYDGKKYANRNVYSDDESDMEAGYHEAAAEEKRSARLAREEDAAAEKEEGRRRKEKEARRKKEERGR